MPCGFESYAIATGNLDLLRVRAEINSPILSVEAPGGQGVKVQEYQAYFELSQRRQAGCIGA
jgi:hypothetical protein